mmetsp:Transcript_2251/g.8027  ORF Transcript_2251/g.8027 Transcript_2251/m.8027 type:complete len:850 (+) Transcript_2251:52-2601(+)
MGGKKKDSRRKKKKRSNGDDDDDDSSSSSSSSSEEDENDELKNKLLAKATKKLVAQMKTDSVAGGLYTDEKNPFNDENLTEKFVWSKKIEKEGKKAVQNLTDKDAQLEREEEIKKIELRRIEYEKARAEREEERDQKMREKAMEGAEELEEKEEKFHFNQLLLRADIRYKNGRAKPIDTLLRALYGSAFTSALKSEKELAAMKAFNKEFDSKNSLFKYMTEKDLQELKDECVNVLKLIDETSEKEKEYKLFWTCVYRLTETELGEEEEEDKDGVVAKTTTYVKEARRSNSASDSPQSLPAVHILNLVTGTGLGQIVDALVPILETLKHAGYETFAVHECGGDPPWKTGWDKLVSCEARPERNNIYHNFKRTYEIGGKQTLTEVMKEYEKYESSNEVDHLNGNMNDWKEILSSKEIYGNAKKMLMVQQMHNKFAQTSSESICTSTRYWFDAPVGDLLELVRKPESEMHRVITFHIRTFADENIGIAFNDDLPLNEELAEKRRDKGKAQEQRIDRIKKVAPEFPKMIQKMVDFCTILFERTGKKTHVAVDSQAVRDYLRKHRTVMQVISTDIVKNEEHYYTEPAYSLNDIADWYLLSLGQTIVGFPTSSSYSSSAHCRGGSVIHYAGTESEFTETVYKVLESEFKEDIFTSETISTTAQSVVDIEIDTNADANNDDNGDENDVKMKLADIPFPPPTDSEFRFHETSSGIRTCLPGVPAEYSDVLTAETVTGSSISPDECLWLNEVKGAGIAASKLPSDCVPDKTVYSSYANEYHWEMLIFNLQNIKDRECFMNRLMIECMDDKAMELCKGSGYLSIAFRTQKLCAHLTTNALRVKPSQKPIITHSHGSRRK